MRLPINPEFRDFLITELREAVRAGETEVGPLLDPEEVRTARYILRELRKGDTHIDISPNQTAWLWDFVQDYLEGWLSYE